MVREMQAAHAALIDYTAVLHKQMRYEEDLAPLEKVAIKFKKPFSVYLAWLEGEHQGREVIYVQGANDGKMWVHNGSFPDITLCLDPKTCQSLSGSRHPITEAGIGFIIDTIAADLARAQKRPLDTVRCWNYGQRREFGEPANCFELVTPPRKNLGYYAHRAYVCQNRRTGLLNRITVWDHRNLVVEDVGFANIRVNVGLQAKDFDPENPDYNF